MPNLDVIEADAQTLTLELHQRDVVVTMPTGVTATVSTDYATRRSWERAARLSSCVIPGSSYASLLG